MTIFGIIFWSICILLIGVGFFLQRKYKSEAPNKSANQTIHEELGRDDQHRNDPFIPH
ncbi:hypothetical protein M3215_01195 [Bacillus cytotoxicus]|uniref:Uncharacterized protein n=1 Tax=Bacillus cytotoxicus TaxID=580165 RepID=A0ACC6A381_9BACI|nr:hypothetical protein [Bacillus cytotoxicus]